MRESDHDCVQSHEDFTDANDDIENTPSDSESTKPATEDVETVKAADRKKDSGLDGLGGGRLV